MRQRQKTKVKKKYKKTSKQMIDDSIFFLSTSVFHFTRNIFQDESRLEKRRASESVIDYL